ncbi:MAG: class I SAM-dependent methyltransferase [Rhodospirillales bacterium]|nr:class I SAM-dependent methyltransferase [Rhodospirillales bacterium]
MKNCYQSHIRPTLQTQGLRGFCEMIYRRLTKQTARSFLRVRAALANQYGLEIEGPTALFSQGGVLPIYVSIARMDNCNFSNSTIWEGQVADRAPFTFDPEKPAGTQFIREATDLSDLDREEYDFVASSHTLEHVADPIEALQRWRGITRPQGHLLLVLPYYATMFDRRRKPTTLEHLIEDHEREVDEGDTTHIEEVLQLHDPLLDPGWGSQEAFEERCRQNVSLRSIHHHVFDPALTATLVAHCGYSVLSVELARPFHIILLAINDAAANSASRDRLIEECTHIRMGEHVILA